MMRFLITALVALSALITVPQIESPGPIVSKDALTDEQLAVYQTVLKDYLKGSDGKLNLSVLTTAPTMEESCGKGFVLEAPPNSSVVHRFISPPPVGQVFLVDPDKQRAKIKQNDPQDSMKRTFDEGKPLTESAIGQSVNLAFSTGMFSLSEVVFDKGHRHAFVSYSFECGRLCGHGNSLLLSKTQNGWKIRKRCGGWVS
jgi:hypothetical protein